MPTARIKAAQQKMVDARRALRKCESTQPIDHAAHSRLLKALNDATDECIAAIGQYIKRKEKQGAKD
jgi:hypothetical protein